MPQWKIGDVQSMDGGTGSDMAGWGFNITRENGRPLVSFMYKRWEEAEKSAKLAKSVIEKAVSLRSYP